MKSYISGMLLAVFLFAAYMSHAQKKLTDAHLTGHVVDAETHEHIPFATVMLKGTHVGISADVSGHFLMKHLPVGKHVVVASCSGYTPDEREVEIFPDRTVEFKFSLRPRSLLMDGVVVTGSRNETSKKESSDIVNIVSSRLFEKTSSNTVAEVLNFQPGLRVEYSCSNCGVPQLRINGLGGQYSQILLDSRPIFSSLAGVYGLEQLPAGMIERVEVIRGGGSALFGSSAIGGVVNIITKEPVRNSAVISNSSGFFRGGADINTTLNASLVTDDYRSGLYVFGMVRNRDDYDRNRDGFSEIPRLKSETIGFRGYTRLGETSRITAEYHHIREFRRGGNHFGLPPHEADIAEQLRHGINGGGLKYDFTGRGLSHRLSLYASMQDIARESYFGTNRNPDAYGSTKDRTYVAGVQYSYSFTRLLFLPSQITVGTEYSNNQLSDRMLGYNRTIDQEGICYGGYLQNEWKDSRWGILIGARLDKHNKVKNPVFSPRVNLRYSHSDGLAFRLSYSSGYRAPQAYEEDLHVAAVGGEVSIISIAPDLRPEYSRSVSGSVDLYRQFGHLEVNLLTEGFCTSLNDVFTLVENGHDEAGNLLLERRNASGAVIGGVNIELKAGWNRLLVLDAGFTVQKSRYKEPFRWSEESSLEPGRRMFRSPDHYGFASLSYTPAGGFSLSASASYSGPMLVQHYAGYIPRDEEVTTPGFWDMGFRAAYKFRLSSRLDMEMSGGIKNMTDAFQADPDEGTGRDAGYIYGPAAPRTWFAGLKLLL